MRVLGVVLIGLAMTAPGVAQTRFQRGIALGLFSTEPGLSRLLKYNEALEDARTTGADHLQLVMRFAQKDRYANDIIIHPDEGLTDAEFLTIVRSARAHGFSVGLMPIIDVLDTAGDGWRGNLSPQNPDEWWLSYTQQMLRYARLAKFGGIDRLVVGSELRSMVHDAQRWRALIEAVRAHFQGVITYSANWDNYNAITFWDALDLVSINAYWPLTETASPSLEELKLAWDVVKTDLMKYVQTIGKPFVFSEVGYRSDAMAAHLPWAHRTTMPADEDLQARCYEAFRASWERVNELHGVYFWNYYGDGGPQDRSFSPRGKRAERQISTWFRNVHK